MKNTHAPRLFPLLFTAAVAAGSATARGEPYYGNYGGDTYSSPNDPSWTFPSAIEWPYVIENGKATIYSGQPLDPENYSAWDWLNGVPAWNGVVPAVLDGCPVTAISGYFTVEMQAALTNYYNTFPQEPDPYFGAAASITLPDTLVSLEDFAFGGFDDYVYHINIPSALETLGYGALPPLNNLADTYSIDCGRGSVHIWLQETREWILGVNDDPTKRRIINLDLTRVQMDGVEFVGIANEAFVNCSYLTDVTLPTTVRIIPFRAFQYCGKLGAITFPASVTNIQFQAFHYNTSLTNIVFEGNAPDVDSRAFEGVHKENCIVTVQRGTTGWGDVPGTWQGMRIHYAGEPLPPATFTITWKDDDGTTLATETLAEGTTPSRPGPTKPADAPYVYTFAGWTPAIATVSSNASYTATYTRAADLSTLTGDWTASDADMLTNSTTHVVTIPAGTTVTINGVTVAGGAGSGATGPATFAADGEAITTSIAPGANGTWMLTAFAELASGSAEGLDDAQVKVYAADTLAGLASAEPMASGVVVTNKAPAVKVELEVTPPANVDAQFFRVGFGD